MTMTRRNDREDTRKPGAQDNVSFQGKNPEGKNKSFCSKNNSLLLNPVTGIGEVPHLKAIDLSNTNIMQDGRTEGAYSDNAFYTEFQKLCVIEPISSPDERHVSADAPDFNIGYEGNRTPGSKLLTTQGTLANESTKDNLFLFVGDEDGDTPLHICIMQEDEINSIHIINRAPDFIHLDVPNNLLQTPVHLAALTNAIRTTRKLICAGANIQSQDRDGNTALHIACSHGHLEIVKQLVKPITYEETVDNKYPIPYTAIPQKMDVKNYNGLTCLHLAVLSDNVDIMRLLMEAGADPNIGDSKSGRTPLHMAAEQGLIDSVYLLISYRRTKIDTINYAGHTPAVLAYSRGYRGVTHLLVRYGASSRFHCIDFDEDNASSDEDNFMDIT